MARIKIPRSLDVVGVGPIGTDTEILKGYNKARLLLLQELGGEELEYLVKSTGSDDGSSETSNESNQRELIKQYAQSVHDKVTKKLSKIAELVSQDRPLTANEREEFEAAYSVCLRTARALNDNTFDDNCDPVSSDMRGARKMSSNERTDNIKELGIEGAELTGKRWVDMNTVGKAVLYFVGAMLVVTGVLALVALSGGAAAIPIATIGAYCGFGLTGAWAITVSPAAAAILSGMTVLVAGTAVVAGGVGTTGFFASRDKGAAGAVGKFVTELNKSSDDSGAFHEVASEQSNESSSLSDVHEVGSENGSDNAQTQASKNKI